MRVQQHADSHGGGVGGGGNGGGRDRSRCRSRSRRRSRESEMGESKVRPRRQREKVREKKERDRAHARLSARSLNLFLTYTRQSRGDALLYFHCVSPRAHYTPNYMIPYRRWMQSHSRQLGFCMCACYVTAFGALSISRPRFKR